MIHMAMGRVNRRSACKTFVTALLGLTLLAGSTSTAHATVEWIELRTLSSLQEAGSPHFLRNETFTRTPGSPLETNYEDVMEATAGSSVRADLTFSETSFRVDFDISLTSDESLESSLGSTSPRIVFSTSEPVGYRISGGFSTKDSDLTSVRYSALLDDVASATPSDADYRSSLLLVYLLGPLGSLDYALGDPHRPGLVTEGTRTGLLLPGRQYGFVLNAEFRTPDGLQGFAGGDGYFQIDTFPVPEPGTGLLLGLGLGGLAAQGAERRRKQRGASSEGLGRVAARR